LPSLSAQETVKNGRVVNSEGTSVKEATVTIVGKDVTASTDENGFFNINADVNDELVIIAGLISTTTNVKVDSATYILKGYYETLNWGLGNQKKVEQNTAAISTLYADDLNKSTVINPENALYGQLAGLMVLQNGGTPWDRSPDIFIRGVSSYGNELVLIDGIERPLSSIVADDIESISVIKDAGALAIYGQRGANGAIVVTTKRGEYESFSVKASYQSGLTTPTRLPKMLNAYKYAQAVNEASALDGNPFVYSQWDLNNFNNNSEPFYNPNVDWIEESLVSVALSTKFNAQFKGGGKNVRYFTSINHQSEDGHFNQTDLDSRYDSQLKYSRFNVRANVDANVSSTTLLKVNVNASMANRTYPGAGVNNIFRAIYNTPSAAFPVKTANGNWGGTETYSNNPIAMISSTGYRKDFERELLGDMTIKQELDILTEGLSAEVTLGYDNSTLFYEGQTKSYEYESVDAIKEPQTGIITDTISNIFGRESDLEGFDSGLTQWRRSTLRAKLNYEKDWDKNKFLASMLYSQDRYVGDGQYNTFLRQNIAGHFHYGYKNKYLVDYTMAYSGSSILSDEKRFGFFPAISAAWVLSEEDFITSSSVDYLKLRASYGITGSDQMSANLYDQQFTGGGSYFFGDNYTTNTGTQAGRLATTGLTYQSAIKSNIGVDMQFFKKLSVTLDVFYEKRNDILISSNQVVSDVIGVNTAFQNDGELENKGFEADVLWQDKVGDFTYYFGGNVTFARSKIINTNEQYLPYDYLKSTGKSLNQQFGLEAIGFFNDQADIDNSPEQRFSEVTPGDIKYKDQNNDGVIDQYDNIPIGYSNALPELYYGIKLGFEIKGFGVDAVFQGIANQTLTLNTSSVFIPLINDTNISEFSASRWVPQNIAGAQLPRLSLEGSGNNYQNSTVWLADADYLKLRSLNVYYNFPENLMNKLKLANGKVFLRGMNLFSIDNIQVLDPEAISSIYPTLASFHIGVEIGL
jgi:TonB-linked SusC/RagA family outer membrane protein